MGRFQKRNLRSKPLSLEPGNTGGRNNKQKILELPETGAFYICNPCRCIVEAFRHFFTAFRWRKASDNRRKASTNLRKAVTIQRKMLAIRRKTLTNLRKELTKQRNGLAI